MIENMWKIPPVPLGAGFALIVVGLSISLVDSGGLIFALFGLLGLWYQRDISKHGSRR